MDNLEKLIQMATIEQMYNMLQKMKMNTNCCSVNTENDSKTMNDILHQIERINGDSSNQFNNLYNMVNQLSVKINEMETELQELKQSSASKQVSGQQTLDKYFNKQEPIRIDINVIQQEEQVINSEEQVVAEEPASKEQVVAEEPASKEQVVAEEQEVVEEQESEELGFSVSTFSLFAESAVATRSREGGDQESEEEPKPEEQEPEEQVVAEEPEQDESSVEEEVVTDDDAEQPTQPQPVVEEEEEVFEIEIDDVTYYATSEENGILYEVLADGDVGKKVGVIKDGEPIFN